MTASALMGDDHEKLPLVIQDSRWHQAVRAICCAAVMIVLSVTLIFFNSHLIRNGFPHAMFLVCLHMVSCTVLSGAILLVRPSWLPALTDPIRKINVTKAFLFRAALPIGAVFAGGLVLGNIAYAYLSVSFCQMIKETNLIFVYLIALGMGIERFSWQAVQVIGLALLGMTLSVHGELNFTLVGFLIQIVALLFEGTRINLQMVILSGSGRLDPLSYVLLISPMCLMLMVLALVVIHALSLGNLVPGVTVPTAETLMSYGPHLALNCLLAFCLNVSIAFLIPAVSSMGYIFCQVTKDICALLVGVLVVREPVSNLQKAAFVVQIAAVYLWSMLKAFPEEMQHGLWHGMW
eukprot:CAMPEP_0178437398 /NCGR_PEP_ID=MMETSP0689_2-20121128/34973_1 /TAXON_ID=160604 /ORGANISM="Amphidinium massartii, Strain CS-259" /LENGTH=348 /DNA_ID=CAMNT_0020059601 /DNA_START=89 /DNA_END=1132 /DNA_ORIENTATION=+